MSRPYFPKINVRTKSKFLVLLSLLASFCLPTLSLAQSGQEAELKKEAVQIIKNFAGQLKPQLKKAMQEKGPVHAVDICATKAPEIAATLSTETGWQVNRVSLKPRNKNSATPSEWESKILEQFDARQTAGEAPAKISHAELDEESFRFMKAQAVEPLCLVCHGQQISPEVREALKTHYQDDKAIAYSLGQIRGAFSLSKSLN